jgi:hypothetical protein
MEDEDAVPICLGILFQLKLDLFLIAKEQKLDIGKAFERLHGTFDGGGRGVIAAENVYRDSGHLLSSCFT